MVVSLDKTRVFERRERPYEQAIVPDHTLFEYTDPQNELAMLARWTPLCERLGIPVLGVRDIPRFPIEIVVDGIPWKIRLMAGEERVVPDEVFARINAAEEAKIPFAYWIWGDEEFSRPVFRAASTPAMYQQPHFIPTSAIAKKRDPFLIAVIATAPDRGMWCKLGAWSH